MTTSVLWAALALAAAVACYGASSLLLSSGADQIRSRSYLLGLVAQGAAFLLAFVARTQVPLLMVQACVTASVAVTAAAGAAMGRWRLGRSELVALAGVVLGITALGTAARPGPAQALTGTALSACAVVTVLPLLAALPGPGRRASAWLLGALAGIGFGGSAVAARALAGDPETSWRLLRTGSGLVAAAVVIGGVLIGQVLLTLAFRSREHPRAVPSALPSVSDPSSASASASASAGTRAQTSEDSSAVTGPVAAMYLTATLWPAVAGLAWLGDAVRPGRGWVALVGLAVALAGAAVLSRAETP